MVSQHRSENDLWVIIDGKVYDLSKFVNLHPGGKTALLLSAGKDATEEFYSLHRAEVLSKYQRLVIGQVPVTSAKAAKPVERSLYSKVPYAEPSAIMGFKSPYYKESHETFRKAVRELFEKEVIPIAESYDDMGKSPPPELFKKLGQAGFLAARIGPGAYLKDLGIPLPGGVKPEEFDFFHEQIAHEENARFGTVGFTDGLGAGLVIGLPPVLHFGKKALAQKVVKEVLSGEKIICLAITEPYAGSDVANIRTTATLSEDGKYYLVSGIKKWITNGTFADYFTTAVRTGGPGTGGVSLLLIERSEGLTTKLIKTSYSTAAGTAWVFMENVRVPVENLLGKENQGFKCIMANFNHERWLIVVAVVRATRLVIEECFKWAIQRKVFGKSLIEQPVIRLKLARMVAALEPVNHWLEHITHQMNLMSYEEQTAKLAGPIALLKLQSTRVSLFVGEEACQIFGGRALTRQGMGRIVEGFQRSVKFAAILGGSEEIMGDLGIRQALKYYPQTAKL